MKEIKGLNNFNTKNVISMMSMFQECNSLEYLDLSNFDTSNVTNMSSMFCKCYNLKQIEGLNDSNKYEYDIVSEYREYPLEYLNIYNIKEEKPVNIKFTFEENNK